ncbi:RrF2 family transcriptional regulator [Duganella qianjiadongensis]|uniref:Rrf2 family transcriptional regulator n=1 Tax=Duganella qianjiadongensis TaxID=2692176 RepID=A0ABW9VJ53_9BURK|nr:Rrf2 family transcriptional regulator [Duganella qianjiadongensis]MYM39312.1 Rrf2 family transcriptional regulator [Duganella qianjiadongensis]
MRLTTFTDYSLRTLLFLSAHRDRLVTIQDIADTHAISKNHLMKVVYQLGLAGLVETVRGRNGGLRLAKEPKDINIGAVIRSTESDFYVAECFDRAHDTCAITPDCVLKHSLHDAMEAFLAVLDKQTLQDLLPPAKGSARPIKLQRGAAA